VSTAIKVLQKQLELGLCLIKPWQTQSPEWYSEGSPSEKNARMKITPGLSGRFTIGAEGASRISASKAQSSFCR
jgi:hypothetical protein